MGLALRRSRESAGLSLKDVERVTGGRFKPSTVAGYERGERSISICRFLSLSGAYAAHPVEMLSEALTGHASTEQVVTHPREEVMETVPAPRGRGLDQIG